MKIKSCFKSRYEAGSVLIGTLIIALVLGVTLASYLSVTSNQHRSIVRSQVWSTSLALAEAGVEEGLACINKNLETATDVSTWAAAAAADGWTANGNVYSVSRVVASNLGAYTVYVTNLATGPSIYSEGKALWRLSSGLPSGFLATAGLAAEAAAPAPVVRRVEVRTQRSSMFTVAMVSLGKIDLKGNNIQTDSFDSDDPNYSNNGLYPLGNPAKTKATGSVVTTSTLVDSLSVGNAKVKGMVKTGPNGTIAIGPNGSVGDRAWVEGGSKGIKPGYSANDVNLQFPSVELPGGNYIPLAQANPKPTINGVQYDYFIGSSGNYSAASLSGKVYIATNAAVKLHITGNVNMTGDDQVTLAPEGASLSIYMSGATFKTAGNAAFNNLSQRAENFSIFGLPSNTSIQITGNGAVTGTIYAPQAELTLGGGGNNVYDFVGASVTKTVTMNGKFNFHYDERLARVGPARGFVPTMWAER